MSFRLLRSSLAMLLVLGLAGTITLFASPPCLAGAPAVPKKTVTIEGITEYQLDNGLRVLLFPDPSTSTVTVNLTVFVGSRHEGYGETGMAHLLEHMVFKGTPMHPEVPRALKEHGANFNGTTSLDRTNYFETMPGNDANLEFGLRLEADRLVNSYVKREDLISEMTVVRNEFEMGENRPEYILSERMMAAAYEWHNYGKSTIGNRSDIERVPIDRLQTFYRKYYQPDNAMLVVAGQFDEAKALTYIARYFGVIKRPQRALDTTYTEEPPQDGERSVVLRRVGKVGMVGALYHIPAGAHPDFPALAVLADILDAEPSGRLYKALVATKKATSVSASAQGLHDPGILEILAQVEQMNSLDKVKDTMLDVLEHLANEPITPEEVERAKRKLLKNRERLMTKSNTIGIVLSNWAAQGDWRLFFVHRDRVAQVTTADVARVANQYFQRNNRTVGLFHPSDKPQRADIPPTPSVAELVKDYKGGQSVTAGEAFEPTPAHIEKRVQRSELPGGLKVALLPKKTRGAAVTALLTLHYGSPESLRGHTSATQFLTPLMARGTKKHDWQQLQDELDRLGARLSPGGLLGTATFYLETKRASLPGVLALLGEMLREPTLPAPELDVMKRERRDSLQKEMTEPSARASRELQRRQNPYPPEDVRYVPTLEESITRMEAVTAEEVRTLYTEQLGAQAGELAIVGDFDPEEVRKPLQDILGDWKAATPYQRIPRPAHLDVVGGRQDIPIPDKASAVYMAGLALAMTDSDPDYPALEVGNYLFGGGPLSSRLANRVRQKEGLSYGVGSRFSADAKDKAADFRMFAICNPANMDKLDKTIAEELDQLLQKGVGESEVAEAKRSFLAGQKVQRASDAHLASMLARELFNGRTMAFQAEQEKKIEALTPEEVSAALRKYLTPKKLIIIRAGSFTKKAAARN